jgi:voltage-gated potassium channel
MYAVLLAAIGFAPIRSTFFHAQPQLFLQRVQAQQTFTTSRSGQVACMETHTKATFFENGLPDEHTLRAALESAFTAIDRDDNAELDSEELARAGFDPELLLTWLDVNRDGKISRDEFVESLLELYSGDSASSMWNQKELRRRVQLYSADSASSMWNQKELRRLHELLSGGSVWGSRTVLRAINAPRFELISLVAVLVTALCYAVGTLPELGNESRFWLNNVEADFTVVFLVEFVLRWWSRSFSLKYLLKPTSLIDLLSIVPTLLAILVTTTTVGPMYDPMLLEGYDGFVLPDLQDDGFAFLRLARVLRLQRYVQDIRSFRRFEAALGFNPLDVQPYQLEVARVVSSIFTLLFVSSGLIYKVEHLQNEKLPDFFTALYFGLTTLTTVGFGDIVPVTAEGRLVVSVSILAGIAIIPVQLSSLAEAIVNRGSSGATAGAKPLQGTASSATCGLCGATGHSPKANFCYNCAAPL